MLLLLLACAGKPDPVDTAVPSTPDTATPATRTGVPAGTASGTPTGTPSGTTTGTPTGTTTGTTPPGARLSAAECAPDATNALRMDCVFQTDPPGATVVLEVTPGDAASMRFEVADAEPITVWGLVPDAPIGWTAWPADTPAASVSSSLPAQSVPLGFESEVTVPGVPGVDAVLTQFGCDGHEKLVVLDTAGRVRWYADPSDIRPDTFRVRGYEVTEDDTVLAVFDNDRIVELAWTGEHLLDIARADRPFHHDLTRRHGYTVALDARQDDHGDLGPVVWDGFTVFDDAGREVAAWDTRGWLDPADGRPCCGDYWYADFPGAFDFAHANAIAVDDDLTVYLSYRYIDTIHAVVGDPLSPEFGQVRWTLVGDPEADVPSDFTLVDPLTDDPVFGSPHHVRPIPGGIGLYDNGWTRREPTRIRELALDGDTATVTTSIDLGLYCPIQGSAFPLPDGTWLTVCSGDGAIFVIDPTTGARTWELLLGCPDGTRARDPYRAVPVGLPG